MSKITIMAPISLGELIDKIAILNIKLENVSNDEQHKNILTERDELSAILMTFEFHDDPELVELTNELTAINRTMWNLEDDVRDYIDISKYDKDFIRVAKDIPFTNDMRCEVKKQINLKFNSHIVEEKLYQHK